MNGSDWVAVAAIVVSAGVGMYVLWATSRQSRRLAGSGFKTVEDLKVDLVALLAALRSAIYKGIAADQSGEPQDVSHELERIRAFQTSPSGYALAALAAKRGSGSDPHAGRWRTLGLHFAELGGIVDSPPHADRSVALTARHWSTEIETTLGSITLDRRGLDGRKGRRPPHDDRIAGSDARRRHGARDLVQSRWQGCCRERSAEIAIH
jgi:hypothetical protein